MKFFILLSTSVVCFWMCAAHAAEALDPSKSTGKPVKPRPLTDEQQKALLDKRTGGSMVGSFNSYASLMYALNEVILHTDEAETGKKALLSPFPKFYKPTHMELFNAIARQMATSWCYDEKRAFWVFAKPALPMPFTVTLAKGWQSEERGNYLYCKPPDAPVGMDVYVMAEFSSDPADQELPTKMREATAMMFATKFKKDVSLNEMSLVKVGNLEALHFKTPTPRPGATWRQWVIAESGQTFVIVSVIDEKNEKVILPDVEAAVQSFKPKP